jgi:hypothetical protein
LLQRLQGVERARTVHHKGRRRILHSARAHRSRSPQRTTGSAEIKWLNGFSLAATFEGEFSSVTRSYAGKGVARYAW